MFGQSIFISLLTILGILVTTGVNGQDTLKGTVVDEQNAPLGFATITLLRAGTTELLAYATTDDTGAFSIRVDSAGSFDVVTRYLGRTTESLHLEWPLPIAPITIILLPSSAELPSIEVTADRRPVTVKNDTTSYSMNAFRDSLDRSVEDVLRKIPGISVSEDGSIEVNGKPIQTILVEDTDLFGMDYQLGSKNIRAHDITTVETIDHYQVDAVLRDVNLSDAVVINLKLREDKRAVLSGEVLGSLGAGNTVKYQLYAPLYRIARKRKTFLLLNADNLTSELGLSASDGVLIGGQESIRTPIFSARGFHQVPRVNTAGLPAIFMDNSKTLVGQIREHYTIGKSRLFVKIGGMRRNTGQESAFRREFLGTMANYTIASTTAWQRTQADLSGEAEYTYTAPDQTFSLRAFAERKREEPAFMRQATGLAFAVDTLQRRSDRQLYRTIASKKLGGGMVAQLTLAYQQERTAEASTFLQADLLSLFASREDTLLTQKIAFRREETKVEVVLLRKMGRLTLRAGLFASRQYSRFSNDVTGTIVPATVTLTDYGPLAQAVYTSGKWLHRLNANYSVNREGFNRNTFNLTSEKHITPEDLLSFQLRYGTRLPDLHLLLTESTFLRSPFDYAAEPQTKVPGKVYSIGFSRRYRNNQRLTSGYLSASAKRTTNGLTQAVSFNGNTSLTRLIAAADQLSATLSGGYSFFSLALKSDVTTGVAATYNESQYREGEEDVQYQTLTYQLSGKTSWLINRRLRLKTDVLLSHTTFSGGVRFRNLSARSSSQLIFSLKGSRFYLGLFMAGNTGANVGNSYANAFLGGQKQLKMGAQEITLYARWYNPLNHRSLASQTTSALYLTETSVGTTGSFAYLTASIGL
ncbi:MAG: hypothetical protein ACI81P_001570 [Neolewinella sp.]